MTFIPLILAASCAANSMAVSEPGAIRTPETSRLFDRHVDPKSGVVSYILKRDLCGFNQQSIYFTAKSMTDDGRFLVLDVSSDEFVVRDGKRVVGAPGCKKDKVLIDFSRDEIVPMSGVGGQIPYIDVVRDRMVYVNDEGFWQRDFKGDPARAELICRLPSELAPAPGKRNRYHTHLTLTPDGRQAFLDAEINGRNTEGVVHLDTGRFEKWGDVEFCCNHGQFNPVDGRQALCAWEYAWEKRRWNRERTSLVSLPRPREDVYPRLWMLAPDRDYRMIAPLESKYATHENFDADGLGLYWCGSGVDHHDLRTGLQEKLCTMYAGHAVSTGDKRALTFDSPACPGWYRGCPWRVVFFNRATRHHVMIHSFMEGYTAQGEAASRLHPDPHPHFVCHDRYVVCTKIERGRMDFSITPVAQLFEKTSAPPDPLPPRKEFDLMWNPSWDVSVPWEVVFDRSKLHHRWGTDNLRAFGVYAHFAGGRSMRLTVDTVKSRLTTDEYILRFRVPSGTVRLTAAANEPEPFSVRDSQYADNLFGEPLRVRELRRWTAADGGAWRWRAGGIVLTGTPRPGMQQTFAIDAAVPPEAAGKPVKFELDVRNRSKYPWWNPVRLRQFDAAGAELGADVVESRELTCLRPVDKTTCYRLDGRLDARAAKVRLETALTRPEVLDDDLGRPLKSPGGDVLEVTRLALRPAASIPFPTASHMTIGGKEAKYYPDTVQPFARNAGSHRGVTNVVVATSYAALADTLLAGLPSDDAGNDGRYGDPGRADRLFGWLCEHRKGIAPEKAAEWFVRAAGLPAAARPDLGPGMIQVFYNGDNRAFDLASGTYGPSASRERAMTTVEYAARRR